MSWKTDHRLRWQSLTTELLPYTIRSNFRRFLGPQPSSKTYCMRPLMPAALQAVLLNQQGAVYTASAILAPLYNDLEAHPHGMAARICLLYLDILCACGQPSQAQGVTTCYILSLVHCLTTTRESTFLPKSLDSAQQRLGRFSCFKLRDCLLIFFCSSSGSASVRRGTTVHGAVPSASGTK